MRRRTPARRSKSARLAVLAGALFLVLIAVLGGYALAAGWRYAAAAAGRQPADVSDRGPRGEDGLAPIAAPGASPTLRPSATATLTASPSPTPTASPTATSTSTPATTPTATATRAPSPEPTRAPSTTPTRMPPPTVAATATPQPAVVLAAAAAPRATTGLVLANYFAWYSANGWDACNISAGDSPLQRYDSDDPAAIATQVRQALDAGIDGFTQQWFAPGERTDANLGQLLERSQGTPFRSTVIFLRHIWPGSPASQDEVVSAIRYLMERYAGNPNWLSIDGRPVIFFTDMYRVPVAPGQTPQQAWADIRSRADPVHAAWWIAEGLDPSYLAVFDGLYVYKVVHAAYPEAYLKAPSWAASVRDWERRTGQRKLWWGTISPGWDDTRSPCMADIRVASAAFKRERADGTFYRTTYDAALAGPPNPIQAGSLGRGSSCMRRTQASRPAAAVESEPVATTMPSLPARPSATSSARSRSSSTTAGV